MPNKDYKLDIAILGKLDPSVIKAINETEAKLKELGASSKTQSAVMSRVYAQAFDNVAKGSEKMGNRASSVFKNLGREAEKLAHKIDHGLGHSLARIGETILHLTGIGAAIGAVGGVIGGAEFIKSSVEVTAERESLRNQVHALLSNQGRGNQQGDIELMVRKMADNEGPIKYEPVMEAVAGMLANDPQRKFKDVNVLHKRLGQLEDVSRDENVFQLVGAAYTKAAANQYVTGAEMRQLSQDSMMPFREYTEKAMGFTGKNAGEQLSKALKKHEVTMDVLNKALDMMTGPGGVAFEHSFAQMQGWNGIITRFEERFRDFKDSFGQALEDFVSPLANKILSALGPGELMHVFDGLKVKAGQMGGAMAALWDSLKDVGIIDHLKNLGNAIHGFIDKVMGGASGSMMSLQHVSTNEMAYRMTPVWQKRLDGLAEVIAKAIDTLTGGLQMITQYWDWIRDGMQTLAALWVGYKAINFASTVRDWLQKIGIMSVKAGIVNVNGPVSGANGNPLKPGESPASKAGWLGSLLADVGIPLAGIVAAEEGIRRLIDPKIKERSDLYDKKTGTYDWSLIDPQGTAMANAAPQYSALKAAQQTADQYRQAEAHDDIANKLRQQQESAEKLRQNFEKAKSSSDATKTSFSSLPNYAEQIASAFARAASSAKAAAQSLVINAPVTVHNTGNSADLKQALDEHAARIARNVAEVWQNNNAAGMMA